MEMGKRCVNCMSDMNQGDRFCAVCGFDNYNKRKTGYVYELPCNFLLHGRYIIGKSLGRGRFGITYAAWDKLLKTKAAVKEYFPFGMATRNVRESTEIFWKRNRADIEERQRGCNNFLEEARKMVQIENLFVTARVRDIFFENETAYIVSDFAEGRRLGEIISKNGVLPFETCITLLRPIMEELAVVHRCNIIHRDISPDNMIIRKDGRVMLVDFGTANDEQDNDGYEMLYKDNGIIEMCTYIDDNDGFGIDDCILLCKKFAPGEQYWDFKIDSWTDVYALCATIYYCITGKLLPSFLERRKDASLWFPPKMDGQISDKAKQILKDSLALKPEERIQSMEELLHRLDFFGDGNAAEPENREHRYKKICVNCLNVMRQSEDICRICGFNMKTQQPMYALPYNFLLHNRYKIERVLGQGGFGITYAAQDKLSNTKVAVKEYFPKGVVTRDAEKSASLFWRFENPESGFLQKRYDSFLKEARKAVQIRNLLLTARVRDVFSENKTVYIVMDYVEGITLKKMLLANGTLTFEACVRLLHPIMEELVKVHRQKIIHRDVSPDNIMVRPDGRAMLLDLGAAKDMAGVNGQREVKKGFSPSEQYMEIKKIGPWTDVYGMCATIYYCVTGKVLASAINRLKDDSLQFPVKMDDKKYNKAKQILKDGLAVKPEERIWSMDELLRRLDEIEEIAFA